MRGIGFVALVFVTRAALAQVPGMMNYQGYLTDGAGAPLTGSYDMTFRLYDGEFGVEIWNEGHFGVNVSEGLFSVLLGGTDPLDASLFAGEAWLEMEVSGEVLTPRVRVVSVGYSYVAALAELTGVDSVDSASIVDGSITDADINAAAAIRTSKLDGTGASAGDVLTYTAGSWVPGAAGASPWSVSGNDVYYDTGNVGIGVAAPGEKLDVLGNTRVQGSLVVRDATGQNLTIPADSTTRVQALQNWQIRPVNPSAGGVLILDSNTSIASNLITRFKYDSDAFLVYGDRIHAMGDAYVNGRLGIGTTSPLFPLDVVFAGAGAISTYDSTAGIDTRLGSDGTRGYVGTFSAHDFGILENGAARLYITGGDVGIGTFTPAAKLDVQYDNMISTAAAIAIDNPNFSGQDVLDFRFAGTTEARIRKARSGDFFMGTESNQGLNLRTNATTRLTVTNIGNVGVGTTTPSAKLDVAGDVRTTGSFMYGTAKTRCYSISASAVSVDDDNWAYSRQPYYVYGRNQGTLVRFQAGVHLPDGARITRFEAGIDDLSSAEDITVYLQYVWGNGNGMNLVSTLTSSGSPGTTTLSETLIVPPTVNNTTNSYGIYAAWWVPPIPEAAADIKFRNARIYYTVTEPLP